MIITVASYKGGVGKTTTSVHVAAYLQKSSPTLLVDGDPNRSATKWAKRGSMPFKIIDERLLAKYGRDYENIVIDTEARPSEEDMATLVEGCDLLILPTTPDVLALDALGLTLETLESIGAKNYKVLLTIVPPKPSHDGDEAREMLTSSGVSVFNSQISRRVAFQKAALGGMIVLETKDPRAESAWKEYESVGKEIKK
ncbi:MAG TPA: ParA family protein [Pyrinomonadaceae bacterium]|jgi:chromosome partitioning protein